MGVKLEDRRHFNKQPPAGMHASSPLLSARKVIPVRARSKHTHLVQHPVQLVLSLPDTVAIVAVHHEDEALRVLEVVPPQRADLRQNSRAISASSPTSAGSHCRPPRTRPQRTLSWPPTSHTVKLMFLYSTVSTLKPALCVWVKCQPLLHAGVDRAPSSPLSGHSPMVGIVVTISPSFSLYRMVVLPAASSPTCGKSVCTRVVFLDMARPIDAGLRCSSCCCSPSECASPSCQRGATTPSIP